MIKKWLWFPCTRLPQCCSWCQCGHCCGLWHWHALRGNVKTQLAPALHPYGGTTRGSTIAKNFSANLSNFDHIYLSSYPSTSQHFPGLLIHFVHTMIGMVGYQCAKNMHGCTRHRLNDILITCVMVDDMQSRVARIHSVRPRLRGYAPWYNLNVAAQVNQWSTK